MGVYIEGVDMPKGETTELIIRVQPNGEIRDSHGILLKPRAEDIDLVRCGECSRRKKNGFCLEQNRYERNDDGFCSYGERRHQ